jgi:hypothetical protein
MHRIKGTLSSRQMARRSALSIIVTLLCWTAARAIDVPNNAAGQGKLISEDLKVDANSGSLELEPVHDEAQSKRSVDLERNDVSGPLQFHTPTYLEPTRRLHRHRKRRKQMDQTWFRETHNLPDRWTGTGFRRQQGMMMNMMNGKKMWMMMKMRNGKNMMMNMNMNMWKGNNNNMMMVMMGDGGKLMRPMKMGMAKNMAMTGAYQMRLSWAQLRQRRRDKARRERKQEQRRNQRQKRREWRQAVLNRSRPNRVNNFVYFLDYDSSSDNGQHTPTSTSSVDQDFFDSGSSDNDQDDSVGTSNEDDSASTSNDDGSVGTGDDDDSVGAGDEDDSVGGGSEDD